MPDLPSRLDLYSLGRDYLVQRATKIDPAQVDIQGSDANLFVGGSSVLGYALVKQLGYSIQKLLLDGAEGVDLDRYAYDRYTLTRKGASPALGSVIFSRPTVGAGAGSIPLGTSLLSLTGAQYITTTVASFGSGDLSSTANVTAVQAGKATQAGANQITTIANVAALFDSSLLVNNPDPTAGGEDAEDDDIFRNRIRDFWSTARRGILAAIEFGALSVPGVVSAMAVEALTTGAQPARVVNLYIADSSGVASTSLAAQVQTALNDFRAAGIAVIISTSLPQIVDIQLKLTFLANVDTLSLSQSIRAAIVEFVNSLPVNGPLLLLQLGSVLQRFAADGLIPNVSSIVSPAGDLIPDPGKTLRTTLTNVTVLP